MNICVFGAASNDISKDYIESCEEFGKKLAQRGHVMVYGGGTGGVMGAIARGATEGKGKIIGISPEFFDHDGILYDKCDELILTDTVRERKRMMEDSAQAFAVLPGGVGTLDELFEVFSLRQLQVHSKPIALYNRNGYFDGLISFVKNAIEEKFMEPACAEMVVAFNDADELLDYLEKQSRISLKF